MSIWTCFFSLCLGVIAILGDRALQHDTLGNPLFKAFIDNTTHFMIAFFSWLVICDSTQILEKKILLQAIACGLMASVIDVDHFIAARSLNLKDAANLHRRPFLHCSTIFIVLFSILYIISKFSRSYIGYELSWLLLTASASHHLRDGYRRGIWLYPFQTIPPYPYYVYLVLITVLPFVLKVPKSMFKLPNLPSEKTTLLI